jgi:hypothetical protein
VAKADTGQIVLQNPQPGTRGTLGLRTIENPGTWSFDANLSKAFQISESKSVQIRFDATNVFNHPIPNNPTLDINNSNPFGHIQEKSAARRQFQAQVRFAF